MSKDIYDYIDQSSDPLYKALECAIKGNLIDFGAKHTFSQELLKQLIFKDIQLTIDDSKQLFDELSYSQSLLYLCDNCGEIKLDLIFIDYIHKYYPHLHIYLNVRSQPILNDICMNDLKTLNIPDYIHITHNGFRASGVLYEHSSKEFQQLFNNCDVIISKGQGNFEALSDTCKNHLYFLFMSKCEIVSQLLNIDNMSIVCKKLCW